MHGYGGGGIYSSDGGWRGLFDPGGISSTMWVPQHHKGGLCTSNLKTGASWRLCSCQQHWQPFCGSLTQLSETFLNLNQFSKLGFQYLRDSVSVPSMSHKLHFWLRLPSAFMSMAIMSSHEHPYFEDEKVICLPAVMQLRRVKQNLKAPLILNPCCLHLLLCCSLRGFNICLLFMKLQS